MWPTAVTDCTYSRNGVPTSSNCQIRCRLSTSPCPGLLPRTKGADGLYRAVGGRGPSAECRALPLESSVWFQVLTEPMAYINLSSHYVFLFPFCFITPVFLPCSLTVFSRFLLLTFCLNRTSWNCALAPGFNSSLPGPPSETCTLCY